MIWLRVSVAKDSGVPERMAKAWASMTQLHRFTRIHYCHFAGHVVRDADREMIEEWKWMGSPGWSHDGIIAVANAHKGKVKLRAVKK
jgi:hypothetical protein